MNIRELLRRKPKSVYFFTFHKCASSLFSQFILPRAQEFKCVNYAAKIYSGKPDIEVQFLARGHIYGPLRLTAVPSSPVYSRLIVRVSDSMFLHNKRTLFMVRDPRDILVSQYYSFGFTHGISPVPQISKEELVLRERIQAIGIDAYVVEEADLLAEKFLLAHTLAGASEESLILRYEDMIEDWPNFSKGLTSMISLTDADLQGVYTRSRPREFEEPGEHKRSGATGGFREKLKPKTVDSLNSALDKAMALFDYTT